MAGGESITVLCRCGKRLKAPAASVGRKARCPACGGVLVLAPVAAAEVLARPAPMPAVVGGRGDGLDALYELAEQASAAAPAAERPRCPQCRTALEDRAVLCTNCGYDTRTGRAVAAATVDRPAKAAGRAKGRGGKQPVDRMVPQGSIVVGVAMSAAFALAASVLWVVVAMATGYMVGYLAILIGAAAGAGMKVGQKGVGGATGIAAAAVTFGTIVVAKLVVIELYLRQHMPGVSIADVDSSRLAAIVFEPIGLVMMVIGVLAAFRAAK
jgi:hypothetical protein